MLDHLCPLRRQIELFILENLYILGCFSISIFPAIFAWAYSSTTWCLVLRFSTFFCKRVTWLCKQSVLLYFVTCNLNLMLFNERIKKYLLLICWSFLLKQIFLYVSVFTIKHKIFYNSTLITAEYRNCLILFKVFQFTMTMWKMHRKGNFCPQATSGGHRSRSRLLRSMSF